MGGEVPAELVTSLQNHAREIRGEVIRMTFAGGGGSPGGSLSMADLLAALLFHELRIDPDRPDWPERDRLVVSKGHAAPALYAGLALRGFLPREELRTYRQIGTRLQGSIDRTALPFVEASAGSLGQGIGMAVGMALEARIERQARRVYAILGEGECQSGSTWEALMAGGHYRLENLVVILDRNGFEADGATESILGIEPIADKLRAFRYTVVEIDGHDFAQILAALATARATADGPTAIVAHTVCGKGVSFMENTPTWQSRAPTRPEAERALAELGVGGPELSP
jgi:transketolase